MRFPLSVAAAFAIAECVTLPSTANASTPQVVSQPLPEQASPNCRNFTMPVIVEGQQRQAVGQVSVNSRMAPGGSPKTRPVCRRRSTRCLRR